MPANSGRLSRKKNAGPTENNQKKAAENRLQKKKGKEHPQHSKQTDPDPEKKKQKKREKKVWCANLGRAETWKSRKSARKRTKKRSKYYFEVRATHREKSGGGLKPG